MTAILTRPASLPNETIDGLVPSLPAGLHVSQHGPYSPTGENTPCCLGPAPCSAHSTEIERGLNKHYRLSLNELTQ